MKIINKNQFNQGISKFKLLSSTAGVGSIITTKFGNYVLIKDINKWNFFNQLNIKLQNLKSEFSNDKDVFKFTKMHCNENGVDLIEDQRFVKFLIKEKDLVNLTSLVGLPHISLNDSFNTPNWNTHPIKKKNVSAVVGNFLVDAILFPKWFRNSKGEFKELYKWEQDWNAKCNTDNTINRNQFAPPRDAKARPFHTRDVKNVDGQIVRYSEYPLLIQNNLILQCHNGHLSDIPWPKFLKWKTKKILERNTNDSVSEHAEDLFQIDNCCASPDLKWSENKTKADGYGSIYIECKKCGHGTGQNGFPKITLEGITNIQPLCIGQKPWENSFQDGNLYISKEICKKVKTTACCANKNHEQEHMKVALVTANNTYYANTFSSVYIPEKLIENVPPIFILTLEKIYKIYNNRLKSNLDLTKEAFAEKIDVEFLQEKHEDDGIDFSGNYQELLDYIINKFLNKSSDASSRNEDSHLNYRFDEYKCFTTNDIVAEKDLSYNTIKLTPDLEEYFDKIVQIEELNVTSVQLNFSRIKPIERISKAGEIVNSTKGQNIFSNNSKEVYALPAVLFRGEGIFIQFKEDKIQQWINKNIVFLAERFEKKIKEPAIGELGETIKLKLHLNNFKQYLIHSFSHMIMRELEFTCGYPTASLKERLYISNDQNKAMCGVLIYTSDGAEGSMGGLMNQALANNFKFLLSNGLNRILECSSDPLCWESDGQGIYELNLASCFACSLIAETACEEMNLGLDRRILIDQEFGFFNECFL